MGKDIYGIMYIALLISIPLFGAMIQKENGGPSVMDGYPRHVKIIIGFSIPVFSVFITTLEAILFSIFFGIHMIEVTCNGLLLGITILTNSLLGLLVFLIADRKLKLGPQDTTSDIEEE